MTVLQLYAFGAPTPGNFIRCLTAVENSLKEKGINTIYAFPEKAREKDWCKEIAKRTKVYFLPEAKPNILPLIYSEKKEICER